MTDVFSKKKRSEIMSKIRPQNTKVEVAVFRELRRRKIYFQKHYKGITGSPDIALPRKKKAVFIDGDFWHGYQFKDRRSRLPEKYWTGKIESNIKRDKKYTRLLKKSEWKVLRVWEHDVKNKFEITIDKIIDFLSD